MKTTRRAAILGSLAAASSASALGGCAPAGEGSQSGGARTRVTVIGAVHAVHRTSGRYSLETLRAAITRAAPDVLLGEVPPDRMGIARRQLAEAGAIHEERTRAFPELTDVAIPMAVTLGFDLSGVAGWSAAIAAERAAVLARLARDPDRASQWRTHKAAQAQYSRAVAGRGDDPAFIHSPEYDVLVQQAQTPYQIFFDPDLGRGGWSAINAAHMALIDAALDRVAGQGKAVVILFGAWHKHVFERSLRLRGDIDLLNARGLFA